MDAEKCVRVGNSRVTLEITVRRIQETVRMSEAK
jgi:hypothetical protein